MNMSVCFGLCDPHKANRKAHQTYKISGSYNKFQSCCDQMDMAEIREA